MDLKKLLAMMTSRKASDLVLSAGAPPSLRVDGRLSPLQVPPLSPEECRDTIAQCMNGEMQAKLGDVKDVDFAYGVHGLGRFRVNVHNQRDTIAAAIRLVSSTAPELKALGLPDIISTFAEKPRGLVLVTGPTGSGKSTTLAAILQHINQTRRCHIITIEDPIEHIFANEQSVIEQREVGTDTPSFASALRHVLRQDPDVIMIGEMRDKETITAALTAAETGHLVFSTLHTNDSAQTLDRIIDVFDGQMQSQVRLQLSMVLVGVVSQQLVERRGGGRVAACEVLVNNPAVANLIRKGEIAQIKNAILTGSSNGMISMPQALGELAARGIIDRDAADIKPQMAAVNPSYPNLQAMTRTGNE